MDLELRAKARLHPIESETSETSLPTVAQRMEGCGQGGGTCSWYVQPGSVNRAGSPSGDRLTPHLHWTTSGHARSGVFVGRALASVDRIGPHLVPVMERGCQLKIAACQRSAAPVPDRVVGGDRRRASSSVRRPEVRLFG
ncbi:hypothetical protein [Streptomyces sp. NPDC055006]